MVCSQPRPSRHGRPCVPDCPHERHAALPEEIPGVHTCIEPGQFPASPEHGHAPAAALAGQSLALAAHIPAAGPALHEKHATFNSIASGEHVEQDGRHRPFELMTVVLNGQKRDPELHPTHVPSMMHRFPQHAPGQFEGVHVEPSLPSSNAASIGSLIPVSIRSTTSGETMTSGTTSGAPSGGPPPDASSIIAVPSVVPSDEEASATVSIPPVSILQAAAQAAPKTSNATSVAASLGALIQPTG